MSYIIAITLGCILSAVISFGIYLMSSTNNPQRSNGILETSRNVNYSLGLMADIKTVSPKYKQVLVINTLYIVILLIIYTLISSVVTGILFVAGYLLTHYGLDKTISSKYIITQKGIFVEELTLSPMLLNARTTGYVEWPDVNKVYFVQNKACCIESDNMHLILYIKNDTNDFWRHIKLAVSPSKITT